MLKQYFEIRKVDEEERMVYGYASTESVDAQGETVTKAAMEAAWDDYMKFANVREMHNASAVGIVKEYSFDDSGVFIGAHIVDDIAWKKVTSGVYKGFSIGGKKLPDGYDAVNKTITGLKLTEISLVDRPANPDALITMYKADLLENDDMTTATQEKKPIEQITEMITKGEISAEQILELVQKSKTTETDPAAIEKSGDNTNSTGTTETQASEPEKTVEVSELRKSFQALKATGEDIKKGLWTVADLANLVNSLRWLQDSVAYEAQGEGDGSTLPGRIAQCVKDLGQCLVDMAQEEVAEMLATLQDANGLPAIEMLISNSASAVDVKKCMDAVNVVKAGARNSAADIDRIQKAHDLLSELGACCADDDTAKVAKVDNTPAATPAVTPEDDVRKALGGEIETLRKSVETITKSYETLNKEHSDLKKRFDDLPAQPKGKLMTVDKGHDITKGLETSAEQEVEPVRKTDGSIDEAATAIKKIHAGGGRPL